VLTKQNDPSVAGISGVEWDAVEISSQFMEYWVNYDRETLYSFAKHYETKEPLPEKAYKSMQDSMHFRSGSVMTGSVYLSKIDLRLHEKFEKGEDVFEIDKALAKEILVTPPLPGDRFLCSFNHIFSGGYSAGYYSYLWSQVLAADAFSAFQDGGLKNSTNLKVTGQRFASTFFALGGGRAPAKVFKDFRGRSQSTTAMLRYNGLKPHSAEFLF
jgi:oligopeptidase A